MDYSVMFINPLHLINRNTNVLQTFQSILDALDCSNTSSYFLHGSKTYRNKYLLRSNFLNIKHIT